MKSLNWATKNLTETRDYAITTTHRHGVKEIIDCFDADWHRKEFKPGESAHLIWCPLNGRDRIAQFIDKRSTRCLSRTSATRTRSSSSASCAPRTAE